MATRHVLYTIDANGNAVPQLKHFGNQLKVVQGESKKTTGEVESLRKVFAGIGGQAGATGGKVVNLAQGLGGLVSKLGTAGVAAGVAGAAVAALGAGMFFGMKAAMSLATEVESAAKRIAHLGLVSREQSNAAARLGLASKQVTAEIDALKVKIGAALEPALIPMLHVFQDLADWMGRVVDRGAAFATWIVGLPSKIRAALDEMNPLTLAFASMSGQGSRSLGVNNLAKPGQAPNMAGFLEMAEALAKGDDPMAAIGKFSGFKRDPVYEASQKKDNAEAKRAIEEAAKEFGDALLEKTKLFVKGIESGTIDPKAPLSKEQLQRLGAHMEAIEATNDKMLEIQQTIAKNTEKREEITGVLGGIMGGDFGGMVGGALAGAIGGPIGMLVGAIISIGPDIGNVIADNAAQLLDFVSGLPNIVTGIISGVVSMISMVPDIVTAIVTAAPQIVMELIRNAPLLLFSLAKLIVDIPVAIVKGLLQLPKAFADAILDAFRQLGGFIKDDQGKFLGTSFKKGELELFGIGDRKNEIPKMAKGGDVLRDGLAFLHAGERVVPAAQVTNNHNNSGGNVFNIILQNPDPARLVEQLRKVLGDLNRGLTLSPVG